MCHRPAPVFVLPCYSRGTSCSTAAVQTPCFFAATVAISTDTMTVTIVTACNQAQSVTAKIMLSSLGTYTKVVCWFTACGGRLGRCVVKGSGFVTIVSINKSPAHRVWSVTLVCRSAHDIIGLTLIWRKGYANCPVSACNRGGQPCCGCECHRSYCMYRSAHKASASSRCGQSIWVFDCVHSKDMGVGGVMRGNAAITKVKV